MYKTLIGAEPWCVMFDKADGFLRDYGGIKYLALFGSAKYNSIFNRIKFLIRLKTKISYTVYHYYAKIKIVLDDDIPLNFLIV